MFTIQYTNDDGGRAVATAMLPPPPTKPITLPWQCGFSWGGKKEEYAKPHTEGREVNYGKMGLTTVAVTHDLLSGMPLVLLRKELIRLWNSILPEPGQPSAQLSKLIRLTACKETKHTVSRWYRTVYIPRLVASYDTHKGKRWLNSNPPKPQGTTLCPLTSCPLTLCEKIY